MVESGLEFCPNPMFRMVKVAFSIGNLRKFFREILRSCKRWSVSIINQYPELWARYRGLMNPSHDVTEGMYRLMKVAGFRVKSGALGEVPNR